MIVNTNIIFQGLAENKERQSPEMESQPVFLFFRDAVLKWAEHEKNKHLVVESEEWD